jgi:hypothetical protein
MWGTIAGVIKDDVKDWIAAAKPRRDQLCTDLGSAFISLLAAWRSPRYS